MGADEWFSIHEFIGRNAHALPLIQEAMAAIAHAGLGAYSWQVVFVPVIASVGITLLISFRSAVSHNEWWILIAGGVIFLGGAFGAESRQAHGTRTDPEWWSRPHANLNLLIEEGLEMFGASIVLLVIARHCWLHESGRRAQVQ